MCEFASWTNQNVCSARLLLVLDVEADQMFGQFAVHGLVHFVQNQIQQIKARYQGRREVDVTGDGPVEVVFGANRIGTGENRCSGIELSDDARFCNGDRLLLLENVC